MSSLAVAQASSGAVSEVHQVLCLLRRLRLDLSTEKHLQEQLAEAFEAAGLAFEREKRLSSRDIPDFLLAGGIVVECKIRGKSRKLEVFQQLQRYAEHDSVKVLVLASNLSMGLPPQILGKSVYVASLLRR